MTKMEGNAMPKKILKGRLYSKRKKRKTQNEMARGG
jgi:hypothetical protein